jgi:hypothetical protein
MDSRLSVDWKATVSTKAIEAQITKTMIGTKIGSDIAKIATGGRKKELTTAMSLIWSL